MAKVIKKAPSKIKYDAAHPIVSCRVSQEIYDRLKALKKAEGKSPSDILKIGLGIVEPSIKKAAEARQQGWKEGHKKGYAEAEALYKVTYSCNMCGQEIPVTSLDARKAAGEYMIENRWGHKGCPGGKR